MCVNERERSGTVICKGLRRLSWMVLNILVQLFKAMGSAGEVKNSENNQSGVGGEESQE